MLTSQQMAAKWSRGVQNGAQSYKDGIAGFTGNPCAMAADAVDRGDYVAGCTRGAAKMSKKLRRTGMDTLWRTNAMGAGATNFTASTSKALTKMQGVYDRWQPIYAQAKAAARALPKSDMQGRWRAAVDVMINNAGT